MNENRGSRGPSWGFLLLIPAVMIIARGARCRRAMWGSQWGASGPQSRGHGHRGPFRGREWQSDRGDSFRLPPMIESMLDAWHTRAHHADSTEPAPSAEPPTA